jgi:O-acetyl-ADP-ribose deacetylase (regulator of RNase III)
MIYEKVISVVDFFDTFTDGNIVLIHGCNCMHTMGGGLARVISSKYPQAYQADLKTVNGDPKKLGNISVARLNDAKTVINCYTQYNCGDGKLTRYTSYDAVDRSLQKVKKYCLENNINNVAVPAKIGCMLGGGCWKIIKAIIESNLDDTDELIIWMCHYEK